MSYIITNSYAKLRMHFEKGTTYIIGDYVINGCQCFHIKDIKKVCDAWNVTYEMEQEVINIHSKMKFNIDDLKVIANNIINELELSYVQDVYDERTDLDMIGKALILQGVTDRESIISMVNIGDNALINILIDNNIIIPEMLDMDGGDNLTVLFHIARKGLFLDILIKSDYACVRETIAKQGYGLDVLIKDTSDVVRKAVAKQGYGLDVLIKDTSWKVRCEVAKQGYGLDILINDSSDVVRKAAAKQGYGLDVLIKDTSWKVRCEVAKQGYGLDVLIKDVREDVRETA